MVPLCIVTLFPMTALSYIQTLEWIKQSLPILTLFPTNTLGCKTVFSPILADSEMVEVAAIKGLK